MRPKLSYVHTPELDAVDELAVLRSKVGEPARRVLDAAVASPELYTQRGTLNKAKLAKATGLSLKEVGAAIEQCNTIV